MTEKLNNHYYITLFIWALEFVSSVDLQRKWGTEAVTYTHTHTQINILFFMGYGKQWRKWIILTFYCSCYCSVTKSCPTLCTPMDCSTPGVPVLHCLPEFAQTHVHWVSDAIQPSNPLSSPSPLTFNLSQHQGLFQGVSSSHQVAKVLELPL